MDSLNTEGIAFKKPTNSTFKLRGSEKRKLSESLSPGLDVFRTFEEPSETIPRRVQLYEQNLNILQSYLKRMQDKFNDNLNGKLLKFIQASFQLIDRVESVVPIGILESNLSIGETGAIFDFIEDQLKQLPGDVEEKVLVSRVQSGTSSSTKAVFQKICGQLIDDQESSDDEDDEESEDASPVKKGQAVRRKGRHFSLYDVKSHLATIKQKYKIVLILEDVDYFSNSIITQLLTLMGCAKLPTVFLFGVTHGQFLQNLIPLNSSSEFVLDKFYSVSHKDRFDEFMRQILFDPTIPFRVSGPIVSYLESQYKEDNFSVEHIFNSLKFCLHYHFLSGKAAYCSLNTSDSYTKRELQLFNDVFTELNVSKATPRKRSKMAAESAEDFLNSSVESLKSWYFFLRLLCFLNLRLPGFPLGELYSSVYAACYEGYTAAKENDENEPFHKFFKSLSSLSKPDLQFVLEECIVFLKKPNNSSSIELAKDVLIHFEQLLSEVVDSDKGSKSTAATTEETAAKTVVKLRRQKNLKELQQSLLEVKRKNEGSSAAYAARTKLTEDLRKLLRKFVFPFSTSKYSQIFVFSDLNHLINAMYPANFLQLNEDIISPGYNLHCECCSNLETASIDANLPDVCIIHKLISEHTTKKVDLNLIYHAFASVVQPTSTGRKSKGKATKEDTAATCSALIRFRRAVGELQHMGFIKRTKSKPDEISRLTWW